MNDIIIRYDNNEIYIQNSICIINNYNISFKMKVNNLIEFNKLYNYFNNYRCNKIEIIKNNKITICNNLVISNYDTFNDNYGNNIVEFNIISDNIKTLDYFLTDRILKIQKIMCRINNER